MQVQKDLRLWLALLCFMGMLRLGVLGAFRAHWDAATGFRELLVALARGTRFDIQIVTLVCLMPLLVSIPCVALGWDRLAERFRSLLAVAFVAVMALLMAIDVGFFREYHAQFDHFLFGAVYDDRKAILSTIWASYHPLLNLGGAFLVAAPLGWLTLRMVQRPFPRILRLETWRWPWLARITLGFSLLLLVAVGARGRASSRPLQMGDAAVVADRCLSAWIPTPLHALGDAYGNWKDMQDVKGLAVYVPDGDLQGAAAKAFPEIGRKPKVDDYLARTAPGIATPARHVFLIIMESYDAWPLLEQWRPLHLTDQVAALGQEGILIKDFLPIGTGTMSSLAGILTGLPDVGVYTAFRPSARQPFASSPAAIFKRLGYRTRFFYAGYLSWQHIGEFCASQGFEEIYGGGDIGNPEGKDWGVDDEELFAFAERTVRDDAPSFNVILTTSNHPPYQVDVEQKGFPLREIPAWTGFDAAGGFDRRILGHLWYSDRSAGAFIRGIERKLPRTVIALTGDHWSRRTLRARPAPFERSAVPLLLHGPQVLAALPHPPRAAGGHLDIAPTLIDLVAPAGFSYSAMGEDLLRSPRHWGLGTNRVIGPGYLMELTEGHPALFPASEGTVSEAPELEAMAAWYRACQGLGWWRLMKGPVLDSKQP